MMGDFKETAVRTGKDMSELQKQGMTASSDSRPRHRVGGNGPCVSILWFPLKLCVESGRQKKAEPLGPHWEGAGAAPQTPLGWEAGLPRAGGAGSAANTGGGTLSWSLPLAPRRGELRAPFASQPRGCPSPHRLKLSPPALPSLPPRAGGRRSPGSAADSVTDTLRGLSSLSTSASQDSRIATHRKVSAIAPNKPAEGRKQA